MHLCTGIWLNSLLTNPTIDLCIGSMHSCNCNGNPQLMPTDWPTFKLSWLISHTWCVMSDQPHLTLQLLAPRCTPNSNNLSTNSSNNPTGQHTHTWPTFLQPNMSAPPISFWPIHPNPISAPDPTDVVNTMGNLLNLQPQVNFDFASFYFWTHIYLAHLYNIYLLFSHHAIPHFTFTYIYHLVAWGPHPFLFGSPASLCLIWGPLSLVNPDLQFPLQLSCAPRLMLNLCFCLQPKCCNMRNMTTQDNQMQNSKCQVYAALDWCICYSAV